MSALKEDRQRVLKTFVSLLGTSTAVESTSANSMVFFGMVKSKKEATLSDFLVKDPTALCTLPSLDIFSGTDMPDLSSLVSGSILLASGSEQSCKLPPAEKRQQPQIPEMKASVLSLLFPEGVEIPQITTTTEPSSSTSTESVSSARTYEEIDQDLLNKGVKNMSEPISWTRSSAPQAPMALVRSLSLSFSSLFDSRMKACTLLLLRHSLSSGDYNSRSRLLALLSSSSSINIQTLSTSFESLTLPQELKIPEEEGKVVLPLLFEASVVLTLGQNKQINLKFKSTGAIEGSFDVSSSLPNAVEVTLDTQALLTAMVEEVQKAVLQAVAASAPMPITNEGTSSGFVTSHNRRDFYNHQLSPPAVSNGLQQQQATTNGAVAGNHLGLLRHPSADLSTTQPAKISPPGSPLQSFASLKLEGMIRDGGNHSKRRASQDALTLVNRSKNRSVTWNQSVKEPSRDAELTLGKRRKTTTKTANTQPKLLSSKSFGKPDASFFECTRNATFAEFGRAGQTSALLACPRQNQNSVFGKNLNETATSLPYSFTYGGALSSGGASGNSRPLSINSLMNSSSAPTATTTGRTKNSLLESFAAASSDGGRNLGDLRGFIGSALGAPSLSTSKSSSPLTTNSS